MADVEIRHFRDIAQSRADANLFIDLNSGELKSTNNNFLNRAIAWVRGKLGHPQVDPAMQETQNLATYNSFLRAIGDSAAYDDGDLSFVEGHLSAQALNDKTPLSSRRVKQLLQGLDERSTPTIRSNRTVAGYFAGKEGSAHVERELAEMIEARPALKGLDSPISAAQKEQLGQTIHAAIMQRGDQTGRKVEFAEGTRIFTECVDSFLDTVEAELATARAADAPDTKRNTQASTATPQAPAATPQEKESIATASAPPATSQPTEPGPLRQSAKSVEIPPKPQQEVQATAHEPKSVQAQNRDTAHKVLSQRLEKWYHEALPGHDKRMAVPAALKNQVERWFDQQQQAVPYDDAKLQIRGVIKDYVAQHDVAALRTELRAAGLPAAVHDRAKTLIRSGSISDKASLATHTNRLLADWVQDNRVGTWYGEATKARGRGIRLGRAQGVPPEALKERVTQAIVDQPNLWSYENLKVHARSVISEFVTQGKRDTH